MKGLKQVKGLPSKREGDLEPSPDERDGKGYVANFNP